MYDIRTPGASGTRSVEDFDDVVRDLYWNVNTSRVISDMDDVISDFGYNFVDNGVSNKNRRRDNRQDFRSVNDKSNDIDIPVSVSMQEYLNGVSRVVKYKRYEHCEVCCSTDGTGWVDMSWCSKCGIDRRNEREISIEVDIPARVIDSGGRILLRNMGHFGTDGYGNAYVNVTMSESEKFAVEKGALYYALTIDPASAVVGFVKKVKHPIDGVIERLEFDGGLQDGCSVRFEGMGIDDGPLVVDISVKMPENISRQQYKLLKSVSRAFLKDADLLEYENE